MSCLPNCPLCRVVPPLALLAVLSLAGAWHRPQQVPEFACERAGPGVRTLDLVLHPEALRAATRIQVQMLPSPRSDVAAELSAGTDPASRVACRTTNGTLRFALRSGRFAAGTLRITSGRAVTIVARTPEGELVLGPYEVVPGQPAPPIVWGAAE